MANKALKTLTNGLLRENPTMVLVLGMCPTLATTSFMPPAMPALTIASGANSSMRACAQTAAFTLAIPLHT